MKIRRIDVERALDDLVSHQGGMQFQSLAVVLAKQHWPELIASERKSDLGADAEAKAGFSPNGEGKVLVCSSTATLEKIRKDAEKIAKNYGAVKKLIFATPVRVTKKRAAPWERKINEEFGYELVIMEREEFVASLLNPANMALLFSHLGLNPTIEPSEAELIGLAREAAAEVVTAWSQRIAGKPLLKLRALRLDSNGRDSSDVLDLGAMRSGLLQGKRLVLEGPAGRGKTTTLIQLAQLHGQGPGTAILISLPDWTGSKAPILEHIAGMPQFQGRGLSVEKLSRVMRSEHLSFLLNGWNEIGEAEFVQADRALSSLERDFPSTGIIVATRTHHLVPPLPGRIRTRLLTLTRRERADYFNQRLAGC
jgi:hypothetical protein